MSVSLFVCITSGGSHRNQNYIVRNWKIRVCKLMNRTLSKVLWIKRRFLVRIKGNTYDYGINSYPLRNTYGLKTYINVLNCDKTSKKILKWALLYHHLLQNLFKYTHPIVFGVFSLSLHIYLLCIAACMLEVFI